jgi:hypothetical protein
MGVVGAALGALASATVFLTLWFALSQPLYPVPIRWGAVGTGVAAGCAITALDQLFRPEYAVHLLMYKTLLLGLGGTAVLGTGLISVRSLIELVPARLRTER